VEDFCAAAFEKGFVSLGFSAHAPIGQKAGIPSDWHLADTRFDEYCETVQAAKKRWKGKLAVFLALEADYIKNRIGPADFSARRVCGLDYIIGSAHYLPSPKDHGADGAAGTPLCVDSPPDTFEALLERFGGDIWALIGAYWDAVEEMLNAGGFEILGHADLIKKNNQGNRYFSEDDPRYEKRLPHIADTIARSGVVVEANTGGLNRGRTSLYPSLPFLRLLKDRDVPVCINADAHKPEDLDGHYDDARHALLSAGYRTFSLLEGDGGSPRWVSEKL
jgi:histidinol-phosphatase (PHP family)